MANPSRSAKFWFVFAGLAWATGAWAADAPLDPKAPAIPMSPAPAESAEAAFLALINQYRTQQALPALALNDELHDAAQWLAQDLAEHGTLSHTDSLARDPFSRMDAFGYIDPTARGENIAFGHDDAAGTFEQWKASPPHNANMLSPDFRVLGIGRYRVPGTEPWQTYWVNDFGAN